MTIISYKHLRKTLIIPFCFFFVTMDEVPLLEEFDRLVLLDDAYPFKESSRLYWTMYIHLRNLIVIFLFGRPFKKSYRHFSFWDDHLCFWKNCGA